MEVPRYTRSVCQHGAGNEGRIRYTCKCERLSEVLLVFTFEPQLVRLYNFMLSETNAERPGAGENIG